MSASETGSLSQSDAVRVDSHKHEHEPETIGATEDPNIVDWDGPDDPANPRNWSKRKKMLNVVLVSLSVLYSYVWTDCLLPCS